MSIDFRVQALPRETFASELNDPDATWLVADASPGYPCRVSLQDAGVGEKVLALSYVHHDVNSPYRASGPIFVRAEATTREPAVNEIPRMLLHRNLSVRGYDNDAMMIAATVAVGTSLHDTIREMFSDPVMQYLHVHNAGPGCFNCAVTRA